MTSLPLVILLLSFLFTTDTVIAKKSAKFFSVFNVIRFQNGPCPSSLDPTTSGVCYTGDECATRGGRSSGSCAQGFGVCCVFQLGCGSRSTENCTYFSSSSSTAASANQFCTVQVCKCNPNICQLRLDFVTFTLSGPSTSTVVSGFALNGQLIDNAANPAVTLATRCLGDFFQVSNPGGVAPPVLCGQNAGEHMYVDASSSCNDLSVFLASTGLVGGTGNGRDWMIKVSQYGCNYENLAPSGCTQWFFGGGSSTGVVSTFNFAGGIHLADQSQSICVRQERQTCGICWTPLTPADFQLSGPGMMGITDDRICCAYGLGGADVRGFDCLVIPQASSNGGVVGGMIKANRFCGASKGLAVIGSQTAAMMGPVAAGIVLDKTICSKLVPFQIRFISDSFEFSQEALKRDVGFRLVYLLQPCSLVNAVPG